MSWRFGYSVQNLKTKLSGGMKFRSYIHTIDYIVGLIYK